MNWSGFRGLGQEQPTFINLDHLQMFKWVDGRLYVYIAGRSVPEIFSDPDMDLYDKLFDYLDQEMRRK